MSQAPIPSSPFLGSRGFAAIASGTLSQPYAVRTTERYKRPGTSATEGPFLGSDVSFRRVDGEGCFFPSSVLPFTTSMSVVRSCPLSSNEDPENPM